MTELMQIRMLAMIDGEIEDVEGSIKNNEVWKLGSSPEETEMLDENIIDLEMYKETLLKLRTNVEKGEVPV